MDVWVNFTNATKWQAERIFKRFFSSPPPAPTPNEALSSTGHPAKSRNTASVRNLPILEEAEIARLSRRFADAVPEGEISVCPGFLRRLVSAFTHEAWQIASLEGYLVRHKASPQACVEDVAKWYGVNDLCLCDGDPTSTL